VRGQCVGQVAAAAWCGVMLDGVNVELVFTGLMVLCALMITWFTVYVIYRLFAGQR
jgi:hypothetical protein